MTLIPGQNRNIGDEPPKNPPRSGSGCAKTLGIAFATTLLTAIGYQASQGFPGFRDDSSGPTSSYTAPADPVDTPTATATCTGLYCYSPHFDETYVGFSGACTQVECPVTGTFTNDGHAAGPGSVTFYLNGTLGGMCIVSIPSTAPGESSTAGCNAILDGVSQTGGTENVTADIW